MSNPNNLLFGRRVNEGRAEGAFARRYKYREELGSVGLKRLNLCNSRALADEENAQNTTKNGKAPVGE